MMIFERKTNPRSYFYILFYSTYSKTFLTKNKSEIVNDKREKKNNK